MLEADLRRCGQRVHGLAGRDAQLRPPEIADELQDPLVHLSSGGERHLPLLPQPPPPGRSGRAPRGGRHREKVTQEDLKTSSPLSRVMGHSRPSSRRRSPWKDPGAMKCVILSFQPSSPAGASSSRSTSCVTSDTSPTRWSTRTGPSEQRSPSTTL